MARARAVDRAWAEQQDALDAALEDELLPCEQTEHEQRVSDDLLEVLAESLAEVTGRYLDPECRFLRHPGHTCHGRDGEPLRQFATCWVEASAQVQEQGRMLHVVEDLVG